jgi:hypothetical protein
MQTKHTPGPWVIGGSLISNGRTPVALVLHNGNGNPSKASDYDRDAPRWVDGADANAALIAAAPELLALVLDALDDQDVDILGSAWVRDARAAIAKATGEQA